MRTIPQPTARHELHRTGWATAPMVKVTDWNRVRSRVSAVVSMSAQVEAVTRCKHRPSE